MPKDFAKKKSPRKTRGASRSNKKQSPPIVLWMFTILLIGGFVSGLIYLKLFKNESIKPIVKVEPKQQTAKPKPKKEVKNQTTDDDIPLYNLHDDLINKEVKISEEDLKLPDNLNKYYYSMRCGSFRETRRAEELKVNIAMTGNSSVIKTIKSKGETWYRVELGPFSRKRAAESIRHRLQDNNIHDCLINPHLIKKK